MHLLQRPLIKFAVLVFFTFALMQGAGRIGMGLLARFETPLNGLLTGFQVNVEGLDGGWRGLNPVVRISRITFSAGFVQNLLVEFDWLESAFRGTPVASRIYVEDAHLDLEKTDIGWRLAGMPPSRFDYNPTTLIKHSDQLSVSGSLGFVGLEGGGFEIQARGENRSGVNRVDVSITSLANDCVDECRLNLLVENQEKTLGMGEEHQKALIEGGIWIPAQVLGGSTVVLNGVRGGWSALNRVGGGSLQVDGISVRLPDSLGRTIETGLHVDARIDTRGIYGSLTDFGLRLGSTAWGPAHIYWSVKDSGVRLWLDELQVSEPMKIVHGLVSNVVVAEQWLGALAIDGKLKNVHGYIDSKGQASYSASLTDFSMEAYRGAPKLRHIAGEIVGYEAGAQIAINAQTATIAFPTLFHEEWQVANLQGVLGAWFKGRSFGLRAPILRLQYNDTLVAGGFTLARPPEMSQRRLSLLLHADQINVAGGRTFIPYKIPETLGAWLESGPKEGGLRDVDFAYRGQLVADPGELSKRISALGNVEDAVVEYHPEWPVVENAYAAVHLSGSNVYAQLHSATSLNAQIRSSAIEVAGRERYVMVDTTGIDLSTEQGLAFIRRSPLQNILQFVEPDWTGDGDLHLRGKLIVPLQASTQAVDPNITVDLAADLDEVDLRMPGYRLDLTELVGELVYSYPYDLYASALQGRIFDRPASFTAATHANTSSILFDASGRASGEDAYYVAALDGPALAQGEFPFTAQLVIGVGDNDIRELVVETDLSGLAINLPGELGKQHEEARKSLLNLQFLDDHTALQFRYGSANGWLRLEDQPVRGAVGIGASAPMVSTADKQVVIAGRLANMDLVEWFSGDSDGKDLIDFPLPLYVQSLVVSNVAIDEVSFADVVLEGIVTNDTAEIRFDAENIAGNVAYASDAPLKLDLDHVYLPPSDAPAAEVVDGYSQFVEDPFDIEVAHSLFDADVTIGELNVGDEKYGRWKFAVRPDDAGVLFDALDADVRDVHIEAPDGVIWRYDDVTEFQGTLHMTNMATVLPQWGYAASLETEKAVLDVVVEWPGSPANVSIANLEGELSIVANNGRFLDVESGNALKIFSLLNFSTLAQRLNFDFSDVRGKGVSFTDIDGKVVLDAGTMTFLEPLTIDGTGSKFVVAGTVDLNDGQLDNEMIITLPVSRGLPWYAAWAAFAANPLIGVGVLVGERVLRKPLEQFSSAKYAVTGSLDEPELKLLSIFDNTMEISADSLPSETISVPSEESTEGE
jgi:uncharacterized protein YhdP